MRICYIVDYRSPIARNWIQYFVDQGHEVHVISTHPVERADQGLAGFTCVPIGFAGLRASSRMRKHFAAARGDIESQRAAGQAVVRSMTRRAGGLILGAYEWIAPFELRRFAPTVRRIIRTIQPDLVHAMRIPFEGILAATSLADTDHPLILSVWGNDFTLHASRVATVSAATRRALARCTALHADCKRDIVLAQHWSFSAAKRTLVMPGSGGIRLEVFHADRRGSQAGIDWDLPPDRPVVINPRRFRPGSVRNDTFFAAIPLVLKRSPGAIFVAVGMQGHPVAERWVRKYGIAESVRLLPPVAHADMASLFRRADVTVSPSNHDGTPNTLLEAMACGAFPIAGDIASVREWIENGRNGLLCDPNSVDSLSRAMIEALSNATLRERARIFNLKLVEERAEYGSGMRQVEQFYRSII